MLNQYQYYGPVSVLTSAHWLLAAPLKRIQTHSSSWANQLVARFAQEVDLVSDTKHPAQSAAMSRGLWFGAGRWKQIEIILSNLTLSFSLGFISHIQRVILCVVKL